MRGIMNLEGGEHIRKGESIRKIKIRKLISSVVERNESCRKEIGGMEGCRNIKRIKENEEKRRNERGK